MVGLGVWWNDRTVLPLGFKYKVGEHLIGWG